DTYQLRSCQQERRVTFHRVRKTGDQRFICTCCQRPCSKTAATSLADQTTDQSMERYFFRAGLGPVLTLRELPHFSQLRRYEAGTTQPTIEVFRRTVLALSVSADMLLFDEGERGPDDLLKLQFEANSKLDDKEREALETVISSVLHMHDAKRWTQGASKRDSLPGQ
ncbi:hypothetical protein, partial [Pseudomonas sivasensis]|uniref:hypothetical protein n=1 Tax=Pseudomonas sivasensis TaxID=1880678 RepID=UPI0030D7699D